MAYATLGWAVGDRFSLDDIAADTVLRYLDVRFPEIAWRSLYQGSSP
jgi:hypothetical protein